MNRKYILLISTVVFAIFLVLGTMTLLAPQPAQSATSQYEVFEDDFDSSTLNARWEWIQQDNSHWSLTANPGYISITTQSGGVSTGNNLLVQPAPAANFEIETHVFFEPSENFQIAGLLVYQDEHNYLLLGREYCGYVEAGCVGNGIYFDHVEDSWLFDENYAMTTTLTNEIYLRLTRWGDQYIGAISENGSNWFEIGTHKVISGFIPTKVGLAALNQLDTPAEIDANFDDFRLAYDTVITIGVATPLSGGMEYIGWPVANAVQLAISQTNQAGGLNFGGITYTLAMTAADDMCNPSQAITVANDLVAEGAVAVVGHVCSGASYQGQVVYNAANIPMLSPSSTSPGLTQGGYTNTFRTISHDGVSPKVLAIYFRQWMNKSRVAIVEGVDPPGTMAGDYFSNTFTSLGGTITSRRQLSSVGEFTSTLTAIQAENPDGIYFVDRDGTRAGLFSKTAFNLSMADVTIGWTIWDQWEDSILDTYLVASGDSAAEGDYVVLQYYNTEDMTGWLPYYNAYVAANFPHYGSAPQIYSGFAYDAANIIIQAIQRVGSAAPMVIRDEIAATHDYEGVVGTYWGFDQYGDVLPPWCWIERFVNGNWQYVYPTRSFLPAIIR
ncbi:MAG: ABC transporter substrate-binding protein [Anaerolineales bacterium]|nr:ABC transporter substrate-binding protein [Anaerolineales bacterium]